jgi:Fe-S-cluster containining protein
MPFTDSIDKIVKTYFSVVTDEEFVYKGKIYIPKPFFISSLLLRGYTCPPNCGGCCPRFSLDYLPTEIFPTGTVKRQIDFNGKKIAIISDMQRDHNNHHCRHLNMTDGRCAIHDERPFSCDFELIRFLHIGNKYPYSNITQMLFTRGWNMLRTDGERGALCEMLPITIETINDVIHKFERLKEWCIYFGLKNKCDKVIDYAKKVKEERNFNTLF